MSDLLLSGAGLILRRFRPEDLQPFLAWRSDPEVARFQSWSPMDEAQAAAFLSDVARMPIPCAGHWAQIAVALPDDTPVGDMGLYLSADGTEAELGISLMRAAQGRGCGRQAMSLAARFMFENSEIKRCLLWSDIRNAASLAMIAALGARQIGQEDTAQPDGNLLREVCFSLDRQDWR